MRSSLMQIIIRMNRSVSLRTLLLFVISFSIPVSAQITITSNDMSKMFTLGYSTTVHETDGNAAIDIGTEGGGNSWDFTGLTENLNYDLLSIDKSEAPYTGEFPDAGIFTYEKGNTSTGQLELWSYYSLDGSFGNLGSTNFSSDQPGDTILIKDNPARIEAKFPMTYNSSWAQTYNQSISYKGMQVGLSSVDWNVVVDGYGMMYLPGGDSSEALRLRQTTTIHTGPIDSTYVTYFFISKYGAQVTLNAVAENPPSEGVINVNGYSWNTLLKKESGGGSMTDNLLVIKPDSGAIFIAGETDTIEFKNWIGGVNLYYSTDNGNFILIDSNYVPESADSAKYYWNVPESLLTRNATIKIEDINSLGYSDNFKIKPWQLTRVDENGNFELFEPDQDGWSFCNCGFNIWPFSWWQQFDYQNGTDPYTNSQYPNRFPFDSAKSNLFPDWPIFVDVSGMNSCYYPSDSDHIYKRPALLKWLGVSVTNWGGSCFGFAISSLLGFYHPEGITPFIGNFSDLYSQNISDDARYTINFYFPFQWGKKHINYRSEHIQNTPRELLAELKETLTRENGDGRVLSFYNNNGSGGHAVVPYKLKRIKNTATFKILLYNSNVPGSKNNFIFLDSVANTWSDSTGLNWGTGKKNCFLREDSKDYLPNPKIFKREFISSALTDNTTDNSRITIFNTTDADMIISSDKGEQIGYKDSSEFNNLTDATALIPETGNFSPPIGYDVPESNYSVKMNNFLDSLSYSIFETDSTYYYYERKDAKSYQTDLFKFTQNGMKIKNSDLSVKKINLQTVIDEQNSEKDFEVNNMTILQDDSINIREMNRKDLLLNNYGSGKDYDLNLRSASADGEKIFFHSKVQLTSNSSHQIIPAWSDIENSKVKILIDNGNDGTIDDSMFISNEITEIKDRYSSNIPTAFALYQNYPNPFNPVTTIKYDLPKQVHVTLKVYNILGEEVAVLVNVEKQPGSYEVKFDGSRLSSGIYFYSIQTGNKTITKKMILLK
jgi:hypothetical protein